MTSKFEDNTCCLDYICSLLPNLAGIFNHYNKINNSKKDEWGMQARHIVENSIGIGKVLSAQFFTIW
jgi:hypothetical protein